MRKLTTIIALAILFSATTAFGQERPIRIGLKFGLPQLAGFNFEYVTPLLNKRLSFDADLTYFPLSAGAAKLSFLNTGINANYYFFKEGRGLYGGLGFDHLSLSAKEDMSITVDSETINASGEGSLGINMATLKIGGKHGGLFYFRWELGYAMAIGDASLDISATATSTNGISKTETESIDIPYDGGIIANIGFGLAF